MRRLVQHSALVIASLAVASLSCGGSTREQAARAPSSGTSTTPPAGTRADAEWWRDAVFYEIYPRSFQDSDGDGVGDLEGIRSRLDYLSDLGVDALWITPFYPSPQVDFGYDVSDYRDVDPRFGTLDDFDRLLADAHARGMRVIVDVVLNHTSDQHAWFRDAASSRESPRRDFYVWHDPVEGGPPNNWASIFEPSAWTLHEETGQYYYHAFYAEQPDLNWRNSAVERAMLDELRFWLDRGADGFRLDAIAHVYEDPEMRDNPLLDERRDGTDERKQEHRYTMFQPETFALLPRLRALSEEHGPDRLLIGEAYTEDAQGLLPFYGARGDGVQLPFNFLLMQVGGLDAAAFRARIDETVRVLGDRATNFVLSNHDNPRAIDRYGGGDLEVGKLLAVMLLTLPGAPFIYYGEEIGMVTTDPTSIDEVQDPVGRRYWPVNKGRDGERTPMQWTGGANAGFTTGEPWLPVPPSSAERNVERELLDPASILSLYRSVIALRRASRALRRGRYEAIDGPTDVLAYRRTDATGDFAVVINTARETRRVDLPECSEPEIALRTAPTPPDVDGCTLAIGARSAAIVAL